ncbi:toxin-like protein [Ranid herpesvirus 3]|uniref:Toxin-like protein n=1 Tax=Ranid herpesvirus 3 TaxID=1987509 RepID=A0A1X9T5M2_9VIRU|nr:toxin-like protein [Ranid herpesvirus 3]ARR28987.1 toxin-like protein [Ranid herpesvirus 3]
MSDHDSTRPKWSTQNVLDLFKSDRIGLDLVKIYPDDFSCFQESYFDTFRYYHPVTYHYRLQNLDSVAAQWRLLLNGPKPLQSQLGSQPFDPCATELPPWVEDLYRVRPSLALIAHDIVDQNYILARQLRRTWSLETEYIYRHVKDTMLILLQHWHRTMAAWMVGRTAYELYA